MRDELEIRILRRKLEILEINQVFFARGLFLLEKNLNIKYVF